MRKAQHFEVIATASFTTIGLPLRESREMEDINLSQANTNLSVAVVIFSKLIGEYKPNYIPDSAVTTLIIWEPHRLRHEELASP